MGDVPEQVFIDAAKADAERYCAVSGAAGIDVEETARLMARDPALRTIAKSAYRAGQAATPDVCDDKIAGLPDGVEATVRIVAVVNRRRRSVHGMTADNAEAQQWCRDLVGQHGDNQAAAQYVSLVKVGPGSLFIGATPAAAGQTATPAPDGPQLTPEAAAEVLARELYVVGHLDPEWIARDRWYRTASEKTRDRWRDDAHRLLVSLRNSGLALIWLPGATLADDAHTAADAEPLMRQMECGND